VLPMTNVMHHVRISALIYLVCIAADSSALAQVDAGPGFDPTPVEIPNIQKAARRAVTTMDLLSLRDLHGIQISPDGRYVAFILGQAVYETNSYRSGLFVIGTEQGSKAVSLGTTGPPNWDAMNQWLPEQPQWSIDSKYLYHRVKNAGIWQVWKWNREGGAPIQLTHMEHDVKSFQISPDSTKLIITVEGHSAIEKKQLAEHGILYDGSIDEFAPKPIIDRIVQMRMQESETWIHDLRDGSEHEASTWELEAYGLGENDPNGAIFNKIFSKNEIKERHVYGLSPSPDKSKVVFMGYVDDFRESAWMSWLLFVKSMDGGGPISITRWAYYGGQYWWSPNSKEVYYTEDEPENASEMRTTKIMAVAATGGRPRLIFHSPGFLHDYSADRSGRLLSCIREDDTTPPEVALVDLAIGKVRTLVDLNPEFQNLQLSPSKQINISNKYGDHFWGHLVFPLGYDVGKRYPLIITTYRDFGGFLRGGLPGDEYPIQVFAANGFAVLNFEALGRLRNNKPNDFDNTILFWESPIDGMKTALSKLWDVGLVDRSKIGITGLSHGAVLVDYGISHTDLFRAAIDSGGGSRDPLTFYLLSDGDRVSFSRLWDLELPENDSLARWQRVSPALNAHRIRTPLLINTADAEYIADMQLVITLRELKKPVEMFIYPNEQHLKNQPRHRYEIYERNVDWFKFWLQNKEDLDPAKADLYKRWRDLRQLQENGRDTATPTP
jgi:dipeptidyl aminopeptidase/acylaminoacyl peptidase